MDVKRGVLSHRLLAALNHRSPSVDDDGAFQPETADRDNADEILSLQEKIKLIEWHINRYDQLRASTANRASVVLSACALLSAGNAVILSQVLSSSAEVKGWPLAAISAGITLSASLIVLSIIQSTAVLISLRPTMQMFPEDDLPAGILFHASDTIRHVKSFLQFRTVIESEHHSQLLEQAEVELWLNMQHYTYRCRKLRKAIVAFRGAALMFLCVLIASIIAYLVLRL